VIGGISLVVGGVGVMNIMLVTVTERTREIGLRKAVGARNWDVLSQFLTESILLCFIGGFTGLVLAYGVLGFVHIIVPQINPVINLASIEVAIGVTCAIGLFFGIYPANQAASLTPLQALRFE
jgi:putative ABC transport system permease protein